MAGRFSRCRVAIMAANTIASNGTVVETRCSPRGSSVATITGIAASDVSRAFARCSLPIMAATALTTHFVVIHPGHYIPVSGQVTCLTVG